MREAVCTLVGICRFILVTVLASFKVRALGQLLQGSSPSVFELGTSDYSGVPDVAFKI